MLTEQRGELPDRELAGRSLVSWARSALAGAGVAEVAQDTSWGEVRTAGALVLHDVLCPLTPAAFLARSVARSATTDSVVVAVHAVTDTVKAVRDDAVLETLDRLTLWEVASPVVLPAGVVGALTDWPETKTLSALVNQLRARFAVDLLDAPPSAHRLHDESALRLLEAYARTSTSL